MSNYPTEYIHASFPSTGVLLLTMNRTPVNAFNTNLWLELGKHFDVASLDEEVRVVVLASQIGKVFTAGLDIT